MSICSTAAPEPETGGTTWRILDAKWEGRSTFTVPETAEILGISGWAAYEAVKSGEIPVLCIGRRKVVPRISLERLLDKSAA